MTDLSWLILALLCIGGVYLVARLITAAYFQSKLDYDRSMKHGTQNQTE